jgi:hypothetical protein
MAKSSPGHNLPQSHCSTTDRSGAADAAERRVMLAYSTYHTVESRDIVSGCSSEDERKEDVDVDVARCRENDGPFESLGAMSKQSRGSSLSSVPSFPHPVLGSATSFSQYPSLLRTRHLHLLLLSTGF